MLPFPKIFYVSPAPELGDYERFVQQKDQDIANSIAIVTPESGSVNSSPYQTNNNIPIRTYCPTYTTLTTVMWGSSFNNIFWAPSQFYRIAQHAFPTQDLFLHSFNNKLFCMMEYTTTNEGSKSYQSITRNGYTSTTQTISGNTSRCINFVYFDNVQQRMMRYNPNTNSTPEFYFND